MSPCGNLCIVLRINENGCEGPNVQFPLCGKESIEWNNLREIKNYLTIYLSQYGNYMYMHITSSITGAPGWTEGLFTMSFLFGEAGQRCGYSINIGLCLSYYVYVVRTRVSIHYVPGPLFADQTSDHPRGQQEQHSIRIEVKWTNTPSRTNKLN